MAEEIEIERRTEETLRADLVTLVHHHYIGSSPSIVKAGKCVDKVLAKIMEHYTALARQEHLEKLGHPYDTDENIGSTTV